RSIRLRPQNLSRYQIRLFLPVFKIRPLEINRLSLILLKHPCLGGDRRVVVLLLNLHRVPSRPVAQHNRVRLKLARDFGGCYLVVAGLQVQVDRGPHHREVLVVDGERRAFRLLLLRPRRRRQHTRNRENAPKHSFHEGSPNRASIDTAGYSLCSRKRKKIRSETLGAPSFRAASSRERVGERSGYAKPPARLEIRSQLLQCRLHTNSVRRP